MKAGDYLIQAWRMRVARKWIPAGSRILDVGCYQGEFLNYLGDKIAPSVGIDPLHKPDHAPTRHQFFPWLFEAGLALPNQSFDALVLLATIEHMQDKATVAREAHRLLHPGGRVVITVPGLLVDKILSILLFLGLVDGMSLEEHHGFIPAELPGIFKQAGFKLIVHKKFQLGLNNLFVFERI